MIMCRAAMPAGQTGRNGHARARREGGERLQGLNGQGSLLARGRTWIKGTLLSRGRAPKCLPRLSTRQRIVAHAIARTTIRYPRHTLRTARFAPVKPATLAL